MYINSPFTRSTTRASRIMKRAEFVDQAAGFAKTAAMWSPGYSAIGAMDASPVSRLPMGAFSPLYQQSNLMLPKDRKTMNAYNRHYYETDYWVGNAIDLHVTYPLGGFEIVSKEREVEKVMNRMAERIDLLTMVLGVGLDYWVYGEAFPYLHWDPREGMWVSGVLYNPDYVDVVRNIFTPKPLISLIPDTELKRLATSTHPKDLLLRDQIPSEIMEYVMRGENIPLSNRNITHIARKTVPHDVRGTSIIQRVWKELMLRDAFREVLFVTAQNHVTPLKIYKVGSREKEYFPTQEELMYWQGIIEEAQNDPNFSLITHDAFDVQYIGASGYIIDVTGYLKLIEEYVLTGLFLSKAFTTSEGPTYCLSEDTEVLTKEHGWLTYDKVTEDDEILTFNKDTEEYEYQKPTNKFVYDYTGKDMIHFQTGKIDILVTPNHRMLVQEKSRNKEKEYNTWQVVEAKDIDGVDFRFRSVADWKGVSPPEFVQIENKQIPINIYLSFIGAWLVEGSLNIHPPKMNQVWLSQSQKNEESYKLYSSIMQDLSSFYKVGNIQEDQVTNWYICDKSLANHLRDTFGQDPYDKHIPTWVKNLDKSSLRILYNAMFARDGYIDTPRLSSEDENQSRCYFTVSKQLADDVYEILMKLGYTPVLKEPKGKSNVTYRIYYSDSELERFPTLETRQGFASITHVKYTGSKVFCFEVPNHFFVIRRNGFVSIQGNSNAVVAYEVLQKRYTYFRTIIEKWLINKVFLPVSIYHGFKNKEGHYIVPQVKWASIDFKKDDAWRSLLVQLNSQANKLVSDRTLVTELGLDYDNEQDQLIKEQASRAAKKKLMKDMTTDMIEGGGLLGGGSLGGITPFPPLEPTGTGVTEIASPTPPASPAPELGGVTPPIL